MVFGKRQIVMATLVVALGVAIYLHSTFDISSAKNDLMVDAGTQTTSNSEGKTYGNTQFVTANQDETTEQAANKALSEDYFIQARLNRKQNRDSAVETLQNVMQSNTATEEEKNNAITTAADIATYMDMESNIENLILAKGFKECMAYIDGGKVTIVVKTDGLMATEAAQIKDIVVNETNLSASNISITEVKATATSIEDREEKKDSKKSKDKEEKNATSETESKSDVEKTESNK